MLVNIRPDDGDLLVRIEDFRKALKDRHVTADDGVGYWATATHYCHEHPVFESKRRLSKKPVWAIGIAWYPHPK